MRKISDEDRWWLGLLAGLTLGVVLGVGSFILVQRMCSALDCGPFLGPGRPLLAIGDARPQVGALIPTPDLPTETPTTKVIVVTATPSATAVATSAPSSTPTETNAPSPTATERPTRTPSPTATATRTVTPTIVPTASPTPMQRTVATATLTPPNLPTNTPTSTLTPTSTSTPRPTLAPTRTPVPTSRPQTSAPAPATPVTTVSATEWLRAPTNQLIIITGGGYASEGGARADAQRIRDDGFGSVIVLFRNDDYRTAIVGFTSDAAARSSLPDVQQEIRSSAYLRNFSDWCPTYTISASSVVRCGTP